MSKPGMVVALIACLVAVGTRGAPAAPRAQPLPSLLSKSRRMLDLRILRKWADPSPDVFSEPICLSDRVALTHTDYADGNLQFVYRINVSSGRAVVLRRLSAELDEYKWGDWKLSNDRRWLLWLDKQDPTPPRLFVATRMDGLRSVSWPAEMLRDPGPAFWIAGTHRWVNLRSYDGRYAAEARFHDVARPEALRRVRLKGLHIAPDLVAAMHSGRVLTTRYDRSGRAVRAPFAEFDLWHPAASVRRWSVPVPLRGTVRTIVASPNHRYLAWLVDTPRHRFDQPWREASVWVSDMRGRHMRALGAILCGDGEGIDEFGCFGWLPSGNRLVFKHERVIYSVLVRRH